MLTISDFSRAKTILNNGGIGVIPTDTIYGVSARAFDLEAVERVQRLRERDATKPFIILISSLSELTNFGVQLNSSAEKFLTNHWPGPLSVILPVRGELEHLQPSEGTLAFRLPDFPELQDLIQATGPLISTSANRKGEPPARNIEGAQSYFGEEVDFYLARGDLDGAPSTLIRFRDGKPEVLRQGSLRIAD